MTAATPVRPMICEGVRIHRPHADAAPWLVETPDGQYMRIGEDAADLLQVANGRRDLAVMAERLHGGWTHDAVAETVMAFEAKGVLRSENTPPRAAPRFKRLTFRPPFSVQFTVVRPQAWFERRTKLMTRIAGRFTSVFMTSLGLFGLLLLAYDFLRVRDSLAAPLSFTEAGILALAFLILSSLHEFGHAATLAAAGVGPRRIGVMLFYLSPAFFCDVTDAWRLPYPRQRVRVALAGVVTSFGLAGAVATWAVLMSTSNMVMLLAVVTYAGALFNLLPLIKLDGYIALMTHLDEPNLRDRALQSSRRWCIRLLFGGRSDAVAGPLWLPFFGVAVTVFTIGLVAVTVHRLERSVANLGVIGSAIDLALGIVVVLGLYRMMARLFEEAIATGVSGVRLFVGSTIALVALLSALTLIHIDRTIDAGYAVQANGDTYLVVGFGGGIDNFSSGDEVTLRRQGGLLTTDLGHAVIGSEQSDLTVPFQALSPVIRSAQPVDVTGIQLVDVELRPDADTAGAAVVDQGDAPLLTWAAEELFINPIIQLGKALS